VRHAVERKSSNDCFAVARPIPVEPPVIRAYLPESLRLLVVVMVVLITDIVKFVNECVVWLSVMSKCCFTIRFKSHSHRDGVS